ncbi:MAG TPA: alpha/beta hydrolase [Flavisolibacter sp.]|nr:alpha/beta hydrolase [Flavisolibacter sp.]
MHRKKNILIVAIFAIVFSCKKETENSAPALPAETLTNQAYGMDTAQKMDIYLPEGRSRDSTKLIVMVHGGAWVTGDKTDFAGFIPILQQRLPSYAIANINYKLATNTSYHFPSQESDMKAAVNYLLEHGGSYSISQKIVLLGASSGAHLATLQAYKYATPKISAVVDFFGPVDMVGLYNFTTNPFNRSLIEVLMSGTPSTNPLLYQQSSPINFVSAQSPPTIIFHGDKDEVVPVAQSIALKDKLQSMGVTNQLFIYPNLGHDLWPDPIMNDAFARTEAFIKTNVK